MEKRTLITEEEAQKIISEKAEPSKKNKKYHLNKIVGLTSPMEISKDGDGIIIAIE